jgi:LDH2 family malate/lactate/ureidoglycolate dehydrogenase
VETVLIPGEPELLAHARRERHGIEVDANTWAALQAIAQELGVALEVEEGW